MEYISGSEAAKSGTFQNGEYKNFVKKTVYRELQSLAICGLFQKMPKSQ